MTEAPTALGGVAAEGTATGSGTQTRWTRPWLLGLLLVAGTFLFYQPAWHGGFIWDDDMYVTDNPLLTAPDGWRRIWFSLDSPSQYFPLTYSTFRIERPFWGLNPTGYHLVNLCLHAANALLLWRLLRRLRVPGAWLAAALFAWHPVQVESVAWITERKNLLSLFFSVLSVLAWLEFIEERPRGGRRRNVALSGVGTARPQSSQGFAACGDEPSPPRSTGVPSRTFFYALALVLYALALSSKTTACTLPGALLLILWLRGKPVSRSRVGQLVPFIVVGLGMGLLAMWWERYHVGTHGPLFALGLRERMLVASRAAWFYVGKLVWPVNLMFSYPRWTIHAAGLLAWSWLAAGAGACAAIAFARRFLGRGPEVAALFYLGTLSPLLGFIMLYTFRYTFVADHYQYVASIGPLALAAAGLARARCFVEGRGGSPGVWGPRLRLSEGQAELLAAVVCASLLGALGALTWRQSGMYRNSETLWRATLARNPGSLLGTYQLGNALLHRGEVEAAIACYQKVLAVDPNDPDVHYNLGNVLLRQGHVDDAIAHYRRVLQIQPRDAEAHSNLGSALFRQGKLDEAVGQFQQALEIRPDFAAAQNNLGFVAWTLATSREGGVRNGPRAVALAEEVNRLAGGNNPMILRTLALAYAETGRFPQALAAARRGWQAAVAEKNPSLATALEQQIEDYQAHGGTPGTAGPPR